MEYNNLTMSHWLLENEYPRMFWEELYLRNICYISDCGKISFHEIIKLFDQLQHKNIYQKVRFERDITSLHMLYRKYHQNDNNNNDDKKEIEIKQTPNAKGLENKDTNQRYNIDIKMVNNDKKQVFVENDGDDEKEIFEYKTPKQQREDKKEDLILKSDKNETKKRKIQTLQISKSAKIEKKENEIAVQQKKENNEISDGEIKSIVDDIIAKRNKANKLKQVESHQNSREQRQPSIIVKDTKIVYIKLNGTPKKASLRLVDHESMYYALIII